MSGKTKRMSQIKQLLMHYQQGKGKKEIARILGISKNTVKSYLEKVSLQKENIESLLSLEDNELERKFHPGNAAYSDERFTGLQSKLDYYLKELGRKGVTRKLLWEEYKQENPGGYGLTQFCYHLSQHKKARRPSMVLEHQAGEKLFIDFAGNKLGYIDKNTGEYIECQVFVATLPYSDYSFVMAVRSQSIEDFLYALKSCFWELGGVPQVLVPDNLKSAVIRSDRYEPTLNKAMEDFANHYRITVVPARVYKPKDKALVENQVKLIYTRVYAKLRNEVFFDISSLNRAIKEKVKAHNRTRMQQKPYSREEHFLAKEKPTLTPLPEQDFELKYYHTLTVAKNNHIYLGKDKHYYSVPYIYIGLKADIIYTRSMVYIYIKDKLVAVHRRSFAQGRYSTEKEHLCSQHQHYLERSPDYYTQKAKGKSEMFYQLIIKIFEQHRYPEQLYRTCDGLFSLERKTEPDKFAKACSMALQYGNYSYQFMSNILKNNMTEYDDENSDELIEREKSLPSHSNVRGRVYYTQKANNNPGSKSSDELF